jgi:hypothetical protein
MSDDDLAHVCCAWDLLVARTAPEFQSSSRISRTTYACTRCSLLSSTSKIVKRTKRFRGLPQKLTCSKASFSSSCCTFGPDSPAGFDEHSEGLASFSDFHRLELLREAAVQAASRGSCTVLLKAKNPLTQHCLSAGFWVGQSHPLLQLGLRSRTPALTSATQLSSHPAHHVGGAIKGPHY